MTTVRLGRALPILFLLCSDPASARETPPRGARPAPTPARPLSREAIKNATFQTPFAKIVSATLSNGIYQEPDRAISLLAPMGTGDLTGDGQPEAAVFLAGVPAKGATVPPFVDLAIVVDENGTPRHLASFGLPPGSKPEKVAIRQGLLTVTLLVPGPKDPACCPSTRTVRRFRLDGDRLVVADPVSATPAAPAP